jgi:uncharacterized protein HemY
MMAFVSSIRNSGFWIRWLWPDVHLKLGELYVDLQKFSDAEVHLKNALSIWEDADQNFEKKVVAQALLSKINSRN